MPSSHPGFIETVINKYISLDPDKTLDIGVGFGKWGILFREYGDIYKGRVYPEHWEKKINGIEIFRPYIDIGHQQFYYDEIFIGDALKILPKLYDYDFIYAGDVIEHLEKEEGIALIKLIKAKSKYSLLSIPMGDKWDQPAMFGNKYEEHKSIWYKKEFENIVKEAFVPRRGSIGLIEYENNS